MQTDGDRGTCVVKDPSGPIGVVTGRSAGRGAAEPERVEVRLHDGRTMRVPPEMLAPEHDGSLRLNVPVSELAGAAGNARAGRHEDDRTVAVAEERLVVGKRAREAGRVVVRVSASQRDEVIDIPLVRETAEVERVPKDEFVDAVPQVRAEGDEIIVPVVEEVVVVERRLRLKEEIRIRRRRETHTEARSVTLRTEQAHIERKGPAQP